MADQPDDMTMTTAAMATPGETPAADAGALPEDSILGSETEAQAPPALVPERYALTAPEGFTLDRAMLESATPIFREAGLTNDQAQKIMPAAASFAEHVRRSGEQQLIAGVLAERKAWAEEARADPAIGGARWQETLHHSARALDALPTDIGQPLRALLNESGLGNKREMIAAMAHFGRAIGEDSIVQGQADPPQDYHPARVMYPNNPPKGQ